MCILDFIKALLYEFHYDCIKNKYKYGNSSRLLFTETDGLMYEIKTKDIYEDFSMDTKMFDYEDFSMDTKLFDFSNYSAKSKYYHGSNRSVFHKIKDKTATVASEKCGRLKQKMTFFLKWKIIHDSSEH